MVAPWLPPFGRRAALVFGALVVLLLAPWPGWGRVFCAAFTVYGNALVAVAGPADAVAGPADAVARFEVPAPGAVGAQDGGAWAVLLRSGTTVFPLDTRIIAYTPLAIFLALALATPVPRRRKIVILGAGLACLLARLAFAVLVPLQRAFGADGAASPLGALAGIAWMVLVTPPVMSYAAPLVAWFLAVALTTPRAAASAAIASRRGRAPRRRRSGA